MENWLSISCAGGLQRNAFLGVDPGEGMRRLARSTWPTGMRHRDANEVAPAAQIPQGWAMSFTAGEIADKQAEWTASWHRIDEDPRGLEGVWVFIHGNHRRNYNLWHEEDCARRDDQGFEYVYRAKRAIDAYNQQRNDFIERIDQLLFEQLKPDPSAAPVNSETPGMIIDRLSILALKVYHMLEQAERSDVSEVHRTKCQEKVQLLRQQRSDLTAILDQFLQEIQTGKRAYRVYFQFKMYNDPDLNPELYGKSS
jgi:hypothetical protein